MCHPIPPETGYVQLQHLTRTREVAIYGGHTFSCTYTPKRWDNWRPGVGGGDFHCSQLCQLQNRDYRLTRLPRREIRLVQNYCLSGWRRKQTAGTHTLLEDEELSHCAQSPATLQWSYHGTPITKGGDCHIFISHQGNERCQMRTKHSVWWLGISKQIAKAISSCTECALYVSVKKDPLILLLF